ncbi:MAG TPA: hypothetical protein VET88_09840, partial [Gammaproteobacteria bacterium]|nr:hypothetical protein [Gammaproteobacteria bacterium]
MKISTKRLATLAFTAACCLPAGVMAESNTDNTGPNYSASAKLNLQVVIPSFLYFQVGSTGTGTVDTITFTPTSGQLGNSAPISGAGGNAASGSGADVVVRGNGGQITITESNNGGGQGLDAGGNKHISLTEIGVDDSANPSLPTPALSDAGGNTSQPVLNGGASQVTNQSSTWV